MSQQQTDSSSDAVYVMAFAVVLIAIFYHFLGDYLLMAHLFLRKVWLTLAVMVTGGYSQLFLVDQRLAAYDLSEWNMKNLGQVSSALRWYMLPVLGTIFGVFAYKVYRKNPSSKLRHKHTRKTLSVSQVSEWPWIAPVLHLDLVKQSIEKGPWAMAKRPVDFAKTYRLLDDKTLNRARAEKLFALQLGRLWEKPSRLPPYVRALYACFAAQLCGSKNDCRDGLALLSMGMAQGKVDYGFVDGLLEKYGKHASVQAVHRQHAYTTTVLCAMLAGARTYGVLPPNYFIWLRPINRPLWYALNSLGRRTPFSEVGGLYGHYLAEKVAGHAIERPYVEEAVNALEKALSEVQFET